MDDDTMPRNRTVKIGLCSDRVRRDSLPAPTLGHAVRALSLELDRPQAWLGGRSLREFLPEPTPPPQRCPVCGDPLTDEELAGEMHWCSADGTG